MPIARTLAVLLALCAAACARNTVALVDAGTEPVPNDAFVPEVSLADVSEVRDAPDGTAAFDARDARDALPASDSPFDVFPGTDAHADSPTDDHADALHDVARVDAASDGGGFAVSCNVIVPDHHTTVAAAIGVAPSPGVVCVRAGTYRERVVMRPHVDIVGEGELTVLDGIVSIGGLPDEDPEPTTIRDVTVTGGARGVAFDTCRAADPDCATIIASALPASFAIAGVFVGRPDVGADCGEFGVLNSFRLSITDSTFRGSRGCIIRGAVSDRVARTFDIVVERNTFAPTSPDGVTYSSLDLLVGTDESVCGTALAASGSRYSVVIRNNEFVRSGSAAVYMTRCMLLRPEDRASTSVEISFNTFSFASPAVAGHAQLLWVNSTDARLEPNVMLSNNVFIDASDPELRGPPPDIAYSNVRAVATDFVDPSAEDYRPSATARWIDGADMRVSVPVDRRRRPRPEDGDGSGTAEHDPGANEAPANGPD